MLLRCKLKNINFVVVIFLFQAFFSGCLKTSQPLTNDLSEPEFFIDRPSIGQIKAVIIVLHGLNLRPSRMQDLVSVLKEHGALVLRPALPGHTGSREEMLGVDALKWRSEFARYIQHARDLAEQHRVPLMFLGYSLGGLIGMDFIASQERSIFQKTVLIAPALAIPAYAEPMIKLVDLLKVNFIVPSPCPEPFKSVTGSSVNAYRALISIKSELSKNRYKNANTDTLIIMDKHDEVISSKNLQKLIADYRLFKWRIEFVDNDYAYKTHGFRHLMIDQDSMGKELWHKVSQKILNHFGLLAQSTF